HRLTILIGLPTEAITVDCVNGCGDTWTTTDPYPACDAFGMFTACNTGGMPCLCGWGMCGPHTATSCTPR
ncbi:MAG: hypothetical protein V4760_08360, partial [Bdellovibrionota bacterium]